MEFLLFYFYSGTLPDFAQSGIWGISWWCRYDKSGENYSGSRKNRGMKSLLILPVQVPSCSLHWRVIPVSGNSAIRFQQLLLIIFKVHSHGAAAAMGKVFILCGSGKVPLHQFHIHSMLMHYIHYFAFAATAKNRVWTHLLAVPLPQLLLLPHSLNNSIRYNGIQLLRQENIAVAAAVATPCEWTLIDEKSNSLLNRLS